MEVIKMWLSGNRVSAEDGKAGANGMHLGVAIQMHFESW